MKKSYYVILTGSKNNAGDYLIKYRAKKLFSLIRPDREIIDLDGWKPFDEETLALVNGSEALILMGGPALQKNMIPNIYPLTKKLNDITTKICFMGIGWKSLSGNWSDTQHYNLSDNTINLLKRIMNDGVICSVRDYHTLNVLQNYGHDNVLMTGCPATYDNHFFDTKMVIPKVMNNISFSLGVSFLESKEMENQMKKTIKLLSKYFESAKKFEVVFHHSTSLDFLTTHNATKTHLTGHQEFISWLVQNGIKYIDISGSAQSLIKHYSICDFHLGYRVHAHIFMSSISKPSILITEDGRGKALQKVLGGGIVDGFQYVNSDIVSKILRKTNIKSGYVVNKNNSIEVLKMLDYEINNSLPQISTSRHVINSNFLIMKKFIKSLP
jgi:hypothetical protein